MKLSVIVITKNNAKTIRDCLNSVKQADEIIIIDDFSTDKTLKLSREYTDKIFSHKLASFAKQRWLGARQAKGDWLLFLDADEQLSLKGWLEIKAKIKAGRCSAYRFKRLNYFYGKLIKHGGYWPDYQTRLFKRSALKTIKGATHEQYIFSGSLGTLEEAVEHFPDRSVRQCLYKSRLWTLSEAQALFKAGHPKITWWRIIKVMLQEFGYRYCKKQGWRDGYIGFAEALTQAINKFFIYQQVWELQQQ